jgi:hypothetical protein
MQYLYILFSIKQYISIAVKEISDVISYNFTVKKGIGHYSQKQINNFCGY